MQCENGPAYVHGTQLPDLASPGTRRAREMAQSQGRLRILGIASHSVHIVHDACRAVRGSDLGRASIHTPADGVVLLMP